MKEIQNLRTGYSREEIFVSTGETDNFMREDRAYDDHLIVIKQSPVDFHLDPHGEESAGKLSDFLFRNHVDLPESVRIIPVMINDSDSRVLVGSCATRDLQARADGGFAHCRMCSERDQYIKCARD